MPFDVVTNNLGLLMSGLLLTIFISVVSIVSGLVLGVGVASAHQRPRAPHRVGG
jgi:ABC-type amino acid transport system permease subunit